MNIELPLPTPEQIAELEKRFQVNLTAVRDSLSPHGIKFTASIGKKKRLKMSRAVSDTIFEGLRERLKALGYDYPELAF